MRIADFFFNSAFFIHIHIMYIALQLLKYFLLTFNTFFKFFYDTIEKNSFKQNKNG